MLEHAGTTSHEARAHRQGLRHPPPPPRAAPPPRPTPAPAGGRAPVRWCWPPPSCRPGLARGAEGPAADPEAPARPVRCSCPRPATIRTAAAGQPRRTIQQALDAVPDGRGGHRVIIRPDTYPEANGRRTWARPGPTTRWRGTSTAASAPGATGWVVIDSGDPEKGFKSWDWWGPIRAADHHWPHGNNRETFSSIVWDRWVLRRLYTAGSSTPACSSRTSPTAAARGSPSPSRTASAPAGRSAAASSIQPCAPAGRACSAAATCSPSTGPATPRRCC